MAMAASGWGGEEIQLYVDGGNVIADVLVPAEDIASRMLATAGLRVVWRWGAPHSAAASGNQPPIVVEFSEHTVPEDHPGAMAFAQPYEGVHIVTWNACCKAPPCGVRHRLPDCFVIPWKPA